MSLDVGVTVDPERQFGAPCVSGTRIPTDVLADMVRAGDPVEFVADGYDLTRAHVIMACWYEGTYGTYQRQWGRWARRSHVALCRGEFDDIKNPPVDKGARR